MFCAKTSGSERQGKMHDACGVHGLVVADHSPQPIVPRHQDQSASTLPPKISALPPKADMCGATRDVCYGPKADIEPVYSITSSASSKNDSRIVRPSALAVLRLTASSYLFGACTGRLPVRSPLRMRSTYEAERRKISAVSGPYDIRLPSVTNCR